MFYDHLVLFLPQPLLQRALAPWVENSLQRHIWVLNILLRVSMSLGSVLLSRHSQLHAHTCTHTYSCIYFLFLYLYLYVNNQEFTPMPPPPSSRMYSYFLLFCVCTSPTVRKPASTVLNLYLLVWRPLQICSARAPPAFRQDRGVEDPSVSTWPAAVENVPGVARGTDMRSCRKASQRAPRVWNDL